MFPRISYLMPTFNRRDRLKALLDVVIAERKDYPNLEIIVVDGGSTDGTVELLESYGAQIDWWVSKADRGLYDALNIALEHATGEAVRMVSDDDIYVTGHLRTFGAYLRDHPEIDAVGGSGQLFVQARDGSRRLIEVRFHTGILDARAIALWPFPVFFIHECIFFRRRVANDMHGWNIDFRVASDLDFITRLIAAGKRIVFLPDVILHRLHNEESFSERHDLEAHHELLRVFRLQGWWFGYARYWLLRTFVFGPARLLPRTANTVMRAYKAIFIRS